MQNVQIVAVRYWRTKKACEVIWIFAALNRLACSVVIVLFDRSEEIFWNYTCWEFTVTWPISVREFVFFFYISIITVSINPFSFLRSANQCPKCYKKFKKGGYLKKHVPICDSKRVYQCDICSYINHKKDLLERHIQQKHLDVTNSLDKTIPFLRNNFSFFTTIQISNPSKPISFFFFFQQLVLVVTLALKIEHYCQNTCSVVDIKLATNAITVHSKQKSRTIWRITYCARTLPPMNCIILICLITSRILRWKRNYLIWVDSKSLWNSGTFSLVLQIVKKRI